LSGVVQLGAVVDAWTLWHFVFGLVLGLRRWRAGAVLALAGAWELLEFAQNDVWLLGTDLGDPNLLNGLADVLVALFAWILVRRR
jgi:hypothetical protein